MRFYASMNSKQVCSPVTLNLPNLKKRQELFACSRPLTAQEPCLILPPEMFLDTLSTGPLAVGTELFNGSRAIARVLHRYLYPLDGDAHSVPVVRMQALDDVAAGSFELVAQRSGPAVAWVTVSDKGAVGARDDASGPAIADLSEILKPRCCNGYIVPDDIYRLRALVHDLTLTQGYDFVITSGGTGMSPRDVTPEALAPLIEKRLTGLEQAMLQSSLAVTARAGLSRPVCGSIGSSLVITLPGSVKAVRENFAAIVGALGHGLEKLQGSKADCGSK